MYFIIRITTTNALLSIKMPTMSTIINKKSQYTIDSHNNFWFDRTTQKKKHMYITFCYNWHMHGIVAHMLYFCKGTLWKECLNSECNQFNQYQPNEQLYLTLTYWTSKRTDTWRWKSRSWLGTVIKMLQCNLSWLIVICPGKIKMRCASIPWMHITKYSITSYH